MPKSLEDLISVAYRKEQEALHEKGYGQRGFKWAPEISRAILHSRYFDHPKSRARPCSILDYGCGAGSLARVLRESGWTDVREYDPAIHGKRALPRPAELVVCTDVLEHIEPDKINRVLGHLAELTDVALFAVISTVPTEKKLSDGRQAHILLRSPEWWASSLADHGFWKTPFAINNPKPEKQICGLWKRESRA